MNYKQRQQAKIKELNPKKKGNMLVFEYTVFPSIGLVRTSSTFNRKKTIDYF